MLRITRLQPPATGEVVLRLDGHVTGVWVEELRRECEETLARAAHQGLILDLANVSYVDADGVALIRALTARCGHIANCSPFVREQLKGIAHDLQ